MTPTKVFLRREQAPLDSLLKGTVVVYRQDGRLWRVSEATWIKMKMAEPVHTKSQERRMAVQKERA